LTSFRFTVWAIFHRPRPKNSFDSGFAEVYFGEAYSANKKYISAEYSLFYFLFALGFNFLSMEVSVDPTLDRVYVVCIEAGFVWLLICLRFQSQFGWKRKPTCLLWTPSMENSSPTFEICDESFKKWELQLTKVLSSSDTHT